MLVRLIWLLLQGLFAPNLEGGNASGRQRSALRATPPTPTPQTTPTKVRR